MYCYQENIAFLLHICDLIVQQIVDFLNVSDEPVLGYAPPTSVTTLHLHLWSCSLDYRYIIQKKLVVLRSAVFRSDVVSSRQAPLSAREVTGDRGDVQHLQQCLFRPLFFNTQVLNPQV